MLFVKFWKVISTFIVAVTISSSQAMAYTGEQWQSQANQKFGTPASMLAHGFLAGVVHSWNGRREAASLQDMCFKAPPEALRIKDLMAVVLNHVSDQNPDLAAPAQAIIRIAMVAEYPCES